MEEMWKPIKELDNLYYVSNFGNIKSVEREYSCGSAYKTRKIIKARIIKPKINNNGYAYYIFSINCSKKQFFIHRLVADAFVSGKTEDKKFVNHKDENPLNNHADNLEWCTQTYNLNYGGRAKKFIDTMNRTNKWKYPPQRVRCFFRGKLLAEFPSVHEAAKFYNIDSNAILRACKGSTKTCLFLKWEFVRNDEQRIVFPEEYMKKLKENEQKRLEFINTNRYGNLLWNEEFENKFKPFYESWAAGKITCVDAAKALGINRKSFIKSAKGYPKHLELVAALK